MAKRCTRVSLLLAFASSLALASDWPQLLGPNRDGVIPGAELQPWDRSGPRELWSRSVGAGLAGPAVAGTKVLLFHRLGNEEVLEALDRRTGKTLWSSSSPTAYRDDFGFDQGPRAVPVVDGDRVFTVGAQGVLTSWNLEDGRQIWQRDTRKLFSVPKGFFGVAASPLVMGQVVMLNVGGKGAGVVAFDRETGRPVWQAGSDEQSYSAPNVALIDGSASALFFTREGLLALDPATGRPLCRFAHKTRIRSSVNAATPIVVGDRIFLSAEYGAGAVLLQLPSGPREPRVRSEPRVRGEPKDRCEPRVVWQDGRSFNNHYATGVHRDGVLYGFHGRQESGPALRAVELNSGKVLWSQERFGAGTVLLSGARLLILREDGELHLIAATPNEYRPLAKAQILEGTTRAYPAAADGELFARGPRELVALALPTKSTSGD